MIGEWILYKDNQILVFNKPTGIPAQPDKTEDKSLFALAEIYCKHPVFLVHRLDRTTSGIVVFAKKASAAAHLSEQFKESTVKKTYLAIVAERPASDEGTLVHYILKDGKSNISKAYDKEIAGSQRAELRYRIIGSSDNYHLLEIDLLTGRHHQIRAQLAAIGCPVKGDVKYGSRRGNTDRSIGLHAWKLSFTHPTSKEILSLTAPPPEDNLWKALLGQ